MITYLLFIIGTIIIVISSMQMSVVDLVYQIITSLFIEGLCEELRTLNNGIYDNASPICHISHIVGMLNLSICPTVHSSCLHSLLLQGFQRY